MLYVNFSDKSLKYVPKWPLSYYQAITVVIFVIIATVNVTWAVVLIINQYEEIGENYFLFFGLIWRGQSSPLMRAVDLCVSKGNKLFFVFNNMRENSKKSEHLFQFITADMHL